MKINPLLPFMKSLAISAGLFCMLQLSGCQDGKSPEEVTTLFWQALSQGQIENAKKHVTQDSQHLVNLQDIEKYSTITTGKAVIADTDAVVETTIFRNKKPVTFNTVLLKEQDIWKVNYLNTQMNISMVPFGDVVKSLQSLGDTFAKQLEQQVPLIQKEMESLGNDLKNQIDELGRSLKKPEKPNNPNTTPGTI